MFGGDNGTVVVRRPHGGRTITCHYLPHLCGLTNRMQVFEHFQKPSFELTFTGDYPKLYRWRSDWDFSIEALTEAPEWIEEWQETTSVPGGQARRPVGHFLEITEGVPRGERKNKLTSLAGLLLGRPTPHDVTRVAPEITYTILHAVNHAKFDPPLPAGDVDRIFVSIAGRERKGRWRRRQGLPRSSRRFKVCTKPGHRAAWAGARVGARAQRRWKLRLTGCRGHGQRNACRHWRRSERGWRTPSIAVARTGWPSRTWPATWVTSWQICRGTSSLTAFVLATLTTSRKWPWCHAVRWHGHHPRRGIAQPVRSSASRKVQDRKGFSSPTRRSQSALSMLDRSFTTRSSVSEGFTAALERSREMSVDVAQRSQLALHSGRCLFQAQATYDGSLVSAVHPSQEMRVEPLGNVGVRCGA